MVSYPNGSKVYSKQPVVQDRPSSFARRGMTLEDMINTSNQFYREHGQAVVYKKPTPIQIVKVDYPQRSKAVIREAYFRQASTTDYNGVWSGQYLDFEAKETNLKTQFPLKNYHDHQIRHFAQCLQQGGICFTIMRFTKLDRYFVFPATALITCWKHLMDQPAIPLAYIEKMSVELTLGYQPPLDYLPALKLLDEGDHNLHE